VFLQLINHFIVLQFQGPFQEHLSPHQFGVSTFGNYEAIPFDIQTLLDLHPNWPVVEVDIEKTFNNVFQVVIFIELCDAEGPLTSVVPFTRLFYGAHFFLYFQHGQHAEGSPLLSHL